MSPKHFVLVHGMCHGAWCWFKLKPLLESAGHRVTALDMGGSGINLKTVEELSSFKDYNEPLMSFMSTSLREGEKVVLVGHSLGGYNLAFAMEEYPKKVEAAVFVAALVPDTLHKPSHFYEELFARITAANAWFDTQFSTLGSPNEPLTVASFGPKFLYMLYDSSPIEDYELAKMLVRPLPNYANDLAETEKFTDERYRSIRRVFVICDKDKTMTEEFARQMIESSGIKEVKMLEDVDHMPMFSKPQQLCNCLVEIVEENTSKN